MRNVLAERCSSQFLDNVDSRFQFLLCMSSYGSKSHRHIWAYSSNEFQLQLSIGLSVIRVETVLGAFGHKLHLAK